MKYEIWCEGFRATGQVGRASYLGSAEGETLEEACVKLAETDGNFANYFNRERMTFWGCRIYDNEGEARQTYG